MKILKILKILDFGTGVHGLGRPYWDPGFMSNRCITFPNNDSRYSQVLISCTS